jgi:hypothetical protein
MIAKEMIAEKVFADTSTCILYLLSFRLLNLVNLQQAHHHNSYDATY